MQLPLGLHRTTATLLARGQAYSWTCFGIEVEGQVLRVNSYNPCPLTKPLPLGVLQVSWARSAGVC